MTIRTDAEQTVKLETLKNMAYAIAKNHLQVKDVYYCTVDGKRTAVIK